MRQITDRITPARVAWLTMLADQGVGHRAKNVVGYQCMQLGWTQWANLWPDGVIRGGKEFPLPFGAWETHPNIGEMLTPEGHQILVKAQRESPTL